MAQRISLSLPPPSFLISTLPLSCLSARFPATGPTSLKSPSFSPSQPLSPPEPLSLLLFFSLEPSLSIFPRRTNDLYAIVHSSRSNRDTHWTTGTRERWNRGRRHSSCLIPAVGGGGLHVGRSWLPRMPCHSLANLDGQAGCQQVLLGLLFTMVSFVREKSARIIDTLFYAKITNFAS